MIYYRYQSDNIFVSVAKKMSRLDPDPTRFVINRLPGSGSVMQAKLYTVYLRILKLLLCKPG